MPPQDANPTPSFGGFGLSKVLHFVCESRESTSAEQSMERVCLAGPLFILTSRCVADSAAFLYLNSGFRRRDETKTILRFCHSDRGLPTRNLGRGLPVWSLAPS